MPVLDQCIDHGKRGTGRGYAQRSVRNRMRYMHRLAYAEAHGFDEATMGGVVRHMCDNPRCVNPMHLEFGTHADNTRDMLERGRANPPSGTRSSTAVLSEDDVQRVRVAEGRQADIAAAFGISQSQVSRIKGGKRWAHSS